MLQITIPEVEGFDERTNEFVAIKKAQTLQLEHSLVSLAKWESKWLKPFISSNKTEEETLDYIRCMTLTQNVDPEVYERITKDIMAEITAYIDAPMTATIIKDIPGSSRARSSELLTAELIYCYMFKLGIPMECQKWHLTRLTTLIRVCSIKSQPPQKMSRKESAARQRSLNQARRQQHKKG